jgi:hypothetical protein
MRFVPASDDSPTRNPERSSAFMIPASETDDRLEGSHTRLLESVLSGHSADRLSA